MNVLHSIRPFWLAFVLWCGFGALTGLGGVYVLSLRAPVLLVALREVDGLAVRGGSLDMLFTLRRTRECDAHVDRWMWQPTGTTDRFGREIRRYVSLPPAANPPTENGMETTYVLSIPLPSNVIPGDWFYRSRTYDGCGWLPAMQRPSRPSPDEPVHIGDAPLATAVPAPELLLPSTDHP